MPEEDQIVTPELIHTESAFKKVYGIEPTKTEESEKIKADLTEASRKILDPLVDAGNLSEIERTAVTKKWEQAVMLDGPSMDAYIGHKAIFYEHIVSELKTIDPEQKDPDVQGTINKGEFLVHNLRALSDGAVAMVNRIPAHEMEAAEQSGLETNFIIVNLRHQELLSSPDQCEAAAIEETCHLISKLAEYDHLEGAKVSRKWVEETMARVVGIGAREGATSQPISEDVKQKMRYTEYVKLYTLIDKQLGGDNPLPDMFVGKEPLDSPRITKLRTVLEQFDFIGGVVDSGIDLKPLVKALSEQSSA